METEKAFLDTSIIISREFGRQCLKEKIKKIENLDKYTTTFAIMEINCSLLKDAIFLYSLLIEERDLTIVFERLQQYPLTPRRRKRCLAILEKLTNKRQLRLADAITRLESLITGLHSLLLRDIKLIESKTKCPLAHIRIEELDQIYEISFSCKRESAKCNLEYFLKENKDNLGKILALNALNSKLLELVSKISEDSRIAKGRNCSKLGDIIICLEAPSNYTIYSTNVNDFEPICKALEKKFAGIR